MKKLLQFVLASMLCLGATSTMGAVIYVNRSAAGPYDGMSWATAFTNVSQGLNLAIAGDQVWVASGTYIERIVINDGVALYGGFGAAKPICRNAIGP